MEQLPVQVQTAIDKIRTKSSKLTLGIGLGGGVIALLFGFIIAKAILGIAAIGAAAGLAAVIGGTVFYGTPVLMKKLSNAKINALIAEAKANPIPTLIAEIAEDERALQEFEKSIQEYDAEVDNCRQTVKDLAPKLTEDQISQYVEDLDNMVALRNELYIKYNAQSALLDQAKIELDGAQAQWEVALAMHKARSKGAALSREDIMSDIMRKTALGEIRRKLAEGRAGLRMDLNKRSTTTTIRRVAPDIEDVQIDHVGREVFVPISFNAKQKVS